MRIFTACGGEKLLIVVLKKQTSELFALESKKDGLERMLNYAGSVCPAPKKRSYKTDKPAEMNLQHVEIAIMIRKFLNAYCAREK